MLVCPPLLRRGGIYFASQLARSCLPLLSFSTQSPRVLPWREAVPVLKESEADSMFAECEKLLRLAGGVPLEMPLCAQGSESPELLVL